MASEKGKLLICDICGESVFISDDAEKPVNCEWTGWTKVEKKDLCPECSREYDLMMKQFIYRRKEGK